MQELADFVPAFSHHFKPLMRNGSQFSCVPFHPGIDGGIPLDSAVESKELCSQPPLHFLLEIYARMICGCVPFLPGNERDSVRVARYPPERPEGAQDTLTYFGSRKSMNPETCVAAGGSRLDNTATTYPDFG